MSTPMVTGNSAWIMDEIQPWGNILTPRMNLIACHHGQTLNMIHSLKRYPTGQVKRWKYYWHHFLRVSNNKSTTGTILEYSLDNTGYIVNENYIHQKISFHSHTTGTKNYGWFWLWCLAFLVTNTRNQTGPCIDFNMKPRNAKCFSS